MTNTANSGAPNPKTIGTKQPEVSYVDRYAVRVVTLNATGHVALIHAQKDNYYKLPGGGIELDEEHMVAAAREVQEETGAVVAMRAAAGCIATTEEFRNDLHQISYLYAADVVDASGKPELTADELVDGLTHEWIPVRQALAKMAAAEPTSELGRFIKARDIYLLGEAIRKLQI
ncbi:NUDIX hydrolase domain-like protein [Nemania sp. FL0916]|nr:NUDIX hydrolase domain-like protein [Nemania sp. FL0916]